MDESIIGEKLSRRKEMAISSLLSSSTLTEAASACGISERTLRRWLRNKTFADRYRREQAAMFECTVNLLRKVTVSAIETLATVAKNGNSPAGARVSAARAIIELGFRGVELQDLGERVAKLEKLREGTLV